jgi:ubiquinol-cytochrome c reductase iron-sulfur subunit
VSLRGFAHALPPIARWTRHKALAKSRGEWRQAAGALSVLARTRALEWRSFVSHADENAGTRRDFLYYATAGAGAVVAGAAGWGLVRQMAPSADVQALASIYVDISGVEPGTQLTVKWLGKPVFIRRRTPEEIEAARAVDITTLPDPLADNRNVADDASAADENRTLDPAGEWLVMIGVCTHLGCVPLGDAGDFGGWFCPCHGSHYDTAGRIRRGPAPRNLPVPLATFENETTLKLG